MSHNSDHNKQLAANWLSQPRSESIHRLIGVLENRDCLLENYEKAIAENAELRSLIASLRLALADSLESAYEFDEIPVEYPVLIKKSQEVAP